MVGTGRFELPTPRTPSECSTRLGATSLDTIRYGICLRILALASETNAMGFSEFIRERQFLTNVSPSTLEWYKHSFKWLDTDSPTQEDLKAAVLKMRAKGLRATGCNSAIRAINAYVHWANAGQDVKCGAACKHPRIAQLKEPQNILPTFTEKQIRSLVEWKPKGRLERRLHLILLFLFDTG